MAGFFIKVSQLKGAVRGKLKLIHKIVEAIWRSFNEQGIRHVPGT